jgi:hypothetical protein
MGHILTYLKDFYEFVSNLIHLSLVVELTIDFKKERTGHCEEKIISASKPYYDQIYDNNLEISPKQAIFKRNCRNCSMHSKVTSFPKTLQPL